MKAILFWRTVLLALAGFVALLAGLYLCLKFPAPGEHVFASFSWAVVMALTIGAGAHGVEHLSNGSGIAGVVKSLFTSAKPGDGAAQ